MKNTSSKLRVAAVGFALAALVGSGLVPATANSSPSPKTGAPTAGEHKPGMHATVKPKLSGPLDGKQFESTCGVEGKTDGNKEAVSFRGGMFRSSYCLSQGFKLAPYSVETKEGVSTFKSEQTDPGKGTLVWEGTVTGDNLNATGTLTSPGKAPSRFWIKAALKPAEHAAHETGGKK